jgi:DNA replication protein DnaC
MWPLYQANVGLPREQRECDVNCKDHPAWRAARDKITRKLTKPVGAVIAIIGDNGTGKTQMAVEVAKWYCRQWANREDARPSDRPILYTRAVEVFTALSDTWGTRHAEGDTVAYYTRPALLVIDEIQDRSGSLWETNRVNNLIDRRYSEKRQTLIVGTLKEGELRDHLGAAVCSRMSQHGGVVVCNWPSFRTGGES